MNLGLFGFPLGHSYSKGIFESIFSSEGDEISSYRIFELQDPMDIIPTANKEGLDGFNITIPHKEIIIPFLDRIDKGAETINAVNVVKKEEKEWVGYNSDCIGFNQSLEEISFPEKKALILGSGGSSRAVIFSLEKEDWETKVVSRNSSGFDFSYADLKEIDISNFSLIVNCTPVGMYPNEDKYPDIPYKNLSSGTFLYDLVYNPEKTNFLEQGEKFGARTKNGLEMLILQARESWRIWNT